MMYYYTQTFIRTFIDLTILILYNSILKFELKNMNKKININDSDFPQHKH